MGLARDPPPSALSMLTSPPPIPNETVKDPATYDADWTTTKTLRRCARVFRDRKSRSQYHLSPGPAVTNQNLHGDSSDARLLTSRPRIPIEVCELVIDHVASGTGQETTATLQSCALVCRRWRSRSQYHLFHAVAIRNLHDVSSFATLLKGSPNIAAYIKEVELVASVRYAPQFGYDPASASVLSAPCVFTRKGQAIRVLSISSKYMGSKFTSIPLPHLPLKPHFSTVYTRLASLTELSLFELIFPTFGDLIRLLTCFPVLRKLKCTEVCYSKPWKYSPSGPLKIQSSIRRSLERLEKLRIKTGGHANGEFVPASLGPSIPLSLPDLCSLIGQINPNTLHHLKIPFGVVCQPSSMLITNFHIQMILILPSSRPRTSPCLHRRTFPRERFTQAHHTICRFFAS